MQLFFAGDKTLSFEYRIFFTGIIVICFAFSSLYGFSFLERSFTQDKILIIRAGFLAAFLSLLFILTSEIYVESSIVFLSLAIFFTAKIFLVYCLHHVISKFFHKSKESRKVSRLSKILYYAISQLTASKAEANTISEHETNPENSQHPRLSRKFLHYITSKITASKAEAAENLNHDKSLRKESHKNMREIYSRKSNFYKFIKRAFDIISSGSALLILSPLLAVTAIAIKLEDGGPVFYAAERFGKDMKNFKMIKFRSMIVNADEKLKDLLSKSEQTGHAFKIKDDPRITRVGKIIRKLSIDELPQLWNIFTGDMSVVGPRPIMTVDTENIDDYDKQRWIVRPGLTCYWQISGRANVQWSEWIEMDLDYIEKMNFCEDMKIIFKTFPVVFKGDGAY